MSDPYNTYDEFNPVEYLFDEGDAVLDFVQDETDKVSPFDEDRMSGVLGSAVAQSAFEAIGNEAELDDDDVSATIRSSRGSRSAQKARGTKRARAAADIQSAVDNTATVTPSHVTQGEKTSWGTPREGRGTSRAAKRKAARKGAGRAAADKAVRNRMANMAGKRAIRARALIVKRNIEAAAKSGKLLAAASPASIVVLILCGILMFVIMFSAITASSKTEIKGLTENEKISAEYLIDKGLDPLHTAAIMANIHAESGFDPALVEVGTGLGHGLCQWSFERWDQLQRYADARGKSWEDIYLQLDFLWAELTGQGDAVEFTNVQYNHAGFLEKTDLAEATRYFGKHFERPNESSAHWELRMDMARKYYAALTGTLSGDGVVLSAMSKLGAPYVWGAAGPFSFDCSGLVVWSYAENGITGLGRTTYEQIRQCSIIPRDQAQMGDLVFMNFSGRGPEHVGIYIGDGQMVHAPTFGSHVKTDQVGWVYSDYVIGRLGG